ncbi:hypothetical protein B7W94_04020 [Microbacterium sp. LEMMJ01]|nr:hypothetical protein B7W94_04020 [Microbacterium sp. LEMMJ01]
MCSRGHDFSASPANRSNGFGCPYCAGQRPWRGETDLATLRPDLIQEWDNSNPFDPDTVTVGSGVSVIWRCARDHRWSARVATRTRRRGSGCPYCAGRQDPQGPLSAGKSA